MRGLRFNLTLAPCRGDGFLTNVQPGAINDNPEGPDTNNLKK